ncbi:MAG: precorrin-2 C(20)-methyltransferase [Firmicutes bacterium]|nr:precorrin-2 C(20)-methyltransferase [Bacillota bacterium]
MKGRFFGVGVGPGDPELITLKGHRVLGGVQVVCSPRSAADRESIALSIAGRFTGEGCEIMELVFPMSRDGEALERRWLEAAGKIGSRLEQGKDVAFVTLGDPGLYSTYAYLVEKLRVLHPEVEIETIPGVAAFLACAAARNTPLAQGQEKLAVVPAPGNPADLHLALQNFENVVLMKVARNYDQVVQVLEDLHLKDKAFFASRCGLEGSFATDDLDSLLGQEKDYFSMLIVKRGGR